MFTTTNQNGNKTNIMGDSLERVLLYVLPFLFSLCFHEYAHAWMASKLGDQTAKHSGRLTLNPLAHIDWMWTVIFPIITLYIGGIFFGSAKPVPVDHRNFKNPDKGMAIVAFAGPASNIILGFVFAIVMSVIINYLDPAIVRSQSVLILLKMLQAGIIINFFLAFFNLIPLPPLDGSRIVTMFLDYDASIAYSRIEPYSFLIIIMLWQFNVLNFLIGVPADFLYRLALGLAL